MKVEVWKIYDAIKGFREVLLQPLTPKIALNVRKLYRSLNFAVEPLEEVLAPYRYQIEGLTTEEAQQKETLFQTAFAPLKNLEEEVLDITFTIDDFEGVKVSPVFFDLIEPFFKEEA